MPSGEPTQVRARFREDQPLWVMAGRDGTLLCARHATAGLVVLSWTTSEELEAGIGALFGHAPHLFASHQPAQRPFGALIVTAARLQMRLRIDDYVVEDLETAF